MVNVAEDAECELNCKPVGLNYFATLNNTVIDGTPCSKPAEYYRRNFQGRAVCVEGICKVSKRNTFSEPIIPTLGLKKSPYHWPSLLFFPHLPD